MTIMKAGGTFLALAALGACLAGRAAASPPAPIPDAVAPAREWKEMLAKVQAAGKFSPAGDPFPARFSLEDVRGPAAAEHAADYINVFGFRNPDGSFDPAYVTLVSEVWTAGEGGNRIIEQWLFEADMGGKVVDRTHRTMTQTPGGDGVGEDRYDRFDDPGAPARIEAEYGALIARWAAFKPATPRL
jgi:hypothetical protein